MRPILPAKALLAAVVMIASAPALAERPVLPGPIPADVLEVVDGDTLAVRATVWLGHSVETRVRLEGIDTPERRAQCPQEKQLAEAAHERLRALVADGRVTLLDVQNDKYGGRVRARVLTAAGADVAEALLTAGLARRYHGERRQSWCDVAALR
ncbi:thermonuclease family protein [Azospirillum sp.]|uniref:thermonuclease family protein n=1 Tax=Azospirillum sp. TaxID=34012 RepID=UPI002D565511|nr:thermonuclease family protein [Azospirillum sp.]HYD70651.1 thermonuclease family protein [Azospirillum sp.]